MELPSEHDLIIRDFDIDTPEGHYAVDYLAGELGYNKTREFFRRLNDLSKPVAVYPN